MSNESPIIETHIFFSSRKDKDIFKNTLERAFEFPVENILIQFEDRPDEFFKTINDRTKKIILSIPKPEKITKIEGIFSDGGSFSLQNNNLTVIVHEDEYNYELLDSMKNILGPIFPLWMFKTPYIWGATLFEDYERQHFFDARNYSVRSQKLDEPELDIYRRDNGIIHSMTIKEIVESEALKAAVEDYRSMCFWNVDENFLPRNRREVLFALDNLEKYGDMKAYRIAGEFRQWL